MQYLGNPMVQVQYQTADNPIFEVFYLANAKATIANFSGNPPKEYSLPVQSKPAPKAKAQTPAPQ